MIGAILANIKKRKNQEEHHHHQHHENGEEHEHGFSQLESDGHHHAHHAHHPHEPAGAPPPLKVKAEADSQFWLPFQKKVWDFYTCTTIEVTVAGLIVVNFIVSICKTQWRDHGKVEVEVYDALDMCFLILFTVELIVNMYGSWCRKFWSNNWNIFDFVIVVSSLLAKIFPALPGVAVCRLFRAFRIFRLFKRLPSLRKIISGILRSLPEVMNAFVLLVIMMSIFSILSTDFLGTDFPLFFGDFFRSMISYFQIMTFDSWSSGIGRPICLELGWGWGVFLIMYVFCNGIVLMQVVVAILLDKYLAEDPSEEDEADEMIGDSPKADDEVQKEKPEEQSTPKPSAKTGGLKLGIGLYQERFTCALEQARLQAAIEKNKREIEEMKAQQLEKSKGAQGSKKLNRKVTKRIPRPRTPQEGDEVLAVQLDRLDVLTDFKMSMRQRAAVAKESMKLKYANLKASETKGPFQQSVADLYDGPRAQKFLAALIGVNFIVSIVETQLLPNKGSVGAEVLRASEWFFNIAFTIELIINMVGHWCLEFWCNPWNLFDVVVVASGLVALVDDTIPGMGVLRLFRAFRVFRLFKRLPSLRKIIIGVLSSMPGVANAFVLLGLVMSIWSVMGVQFFREGYPDEYGHFFLAMLTQIQIMTFDSWCSGVTRQIVLDEVHGGPHYAIFFISYVFVTSIIMQNVVVAILLDKYLSATQDQSDGDAEGTEAVEDNLTEADARILEIQEKILMKMRSIEAMLLFQGRKK